MPALPSVLRDEAKAAAARRSRVTVGPAREDLDKATGRQTPPNESFARAAGQKAPDETDPDREAKPDRKVRRYGPKKDQRRDPDRSL